MTKAEQREAAEQIDRGEVDAPGWYREGLVGAMLVLQGRPRADGGVAG